MTTSEKRNLLHYIIGAMFAYLVLNLTKYHDYSGTWNFIGALAIGFVFSGVIGIFYEIMQEAFKVSKFNIEDVLRTAYGGVIGGVLAWFFPSNTLFYIFLFSTVIIGGLDFYLHFYKGRKNDFFKYFTDENENS
jgi:glycopeptide antibiotics resistance protein